MSSSRTAKITEEHKAEARRLKAIWNRASPRFSQEEFGAKFDVGSQAAVGFFLNGKSALSLKAAKGFAKGLGCEISAFSPRLAAEIDQLARPAANVETPQTDGVWPFTDAIRKVIQSLGPTDLVFLENAMRNHLKMEFLAAPQVNDPGNGNGQPTHQRRAA